MSHLTDICSINMMDKKTGSEREKERFIIIPLLPAASLLLAPPHPCCLAFDFPAPLLSHLAIDTALIDFWLQVRALAEFGFSLVYFSPCSEEAPRSKEKTGGEILLSDSVLRRPKEGSFSPLASQPQNPDPRAGARVRAVSWVGHGDGWTNQGRPPGRGVAGPPPLPSACPYSWVPALLIAHLSHTATRQSLAFANERVIGHLKRS